MGASKMVSDSGSIEAMGVTLRISLIVSSQNKFYLCSMQLHMLIDVDSSVKKISHFHMVNPKKNLTTDSVPAFFLNGYIWMNAVQISCVMCMMHGDDCESESTTLSAVIFYLRCVSGRLGKRKGIFRF